MTYSMTFIKHDNPIDYLIFINSDVIENKGFNMSNTINAHNKIDIQYSQHVDSKLKLAFKK